MFTVGKVDTAPCAIIVWTIAASGACTKQSVRAYVYALQYAAKNLMPLPAKLMDWDARSTTFKSETAECDKFNEVGLNGFTRLSECRQGVCHGSADKAHWNFVVSQIDGRGKWHPL